MLIYPIRQSSSLVMRDPNRAGFETCLLCYKADEELLNKYKQALENKTRDDAQELVDIVQRRSG